MTQSVTSELTKQLIADSLKKLMREKPLNKISIRELVAECGLNRQTFYYHFQDIYALLEWIVEKEIISVLGNSDNFLTWQEAGVYFLKYLKQNSTIVLCALNSMGRTALKNFLFDDIFKVATLYIENVSSDIKVSEKNFNHVVHFYAVTFGALLEDWLSTGMPDEPEDLINILNTIVRGTARTALQRFAIQETKEEVL